MTQSGLAFFGESVLAHAGHGFTDSSSPLHYALEPAHGLAAFCVVAAGIGLLVLFRRWSSHQKLQPIPVRKQHNSRSR